jgi:putative ABC transport system ATP-binding protein
VFQTFNLLARDSLKNVELPLVYAGVSAGNDAGWRRKRCARWVDRLRHHPNGFGGSSSGHRPGAGQSAVDHLADEPTGNLASKSGVEIMRILQDLNRAGDHRGAGDARPLHRPPLSASGAAA